MTLPSEEIKRIAKSMVLHEGAHRGYDAAVQHTERFGVQMDKVEENVPLMLAAILRYLDDRHNKII